MTSSQLDRIAPLADDPAFRARWGEIKRANKERLAAVVARDCHVDFPVEAMFDVQVKRIHEYKRQLLNILHVIHLYNRIKRGDTADWTPRCVLIGGKAAPGYFMAKLIIKLINNVAQRVNEDEETDGLLRVAFIPDYRVTLMEVIAPGADLSEQISTAGKEASGTGNMKFMMNGAVTIGTLDGANIEIREQAGDENFFLFGLTAAEVDATRGHYDPNAIIAGDPGPGRGHEPDRVRAFQPVRAGALRPHHPRHPQPAGPLAHGGGLPHLCGRPGTRRRRLSRPGALDAHGHPQQRPQRAFLLRPHHRRVQPGHLGPGPRDPAAGALMTGVRYPPSGIPHTCLANSTSGRQIGPKPSEALVDLADFRTWALKSAPFGSAPFSTSRHTRASIAAFSGTNRESFVSIAPQVLFFNTLWLLFPTVTIGLTHSRARRTIGDRYP